MLDCLCFTFYKVKQYVWYIVNLNEAKEIYYPCKVSTFLIKLKWIAGLEKCLELKAPRQHYKFAIITTVAFCSFLVTSFIKIFQESRQQRS